MNQQEPKVISEAQRILGIDFNRLRERCVKILGNNEDLLAQIDEMKSHYEGQLRDADDTISKLESDNATLNQLLDDRDQRIVDLSERVEREIKKNARAVSTFDGIEQHIKLMRGEVHADELAAGKLGNGALEDQPNEVHQGLKEMEATIRSHLRGGRTTHPALQDTPYEAVRSDAAETAQRLDQDSKA